MQFQTRFRAATLVVCISAPLAHAQFYGAPPDATHPWAVHDMNRPQPPRVEPGVTPGAPPSDAIVLFDGTEASLSNWEPVKPQRKGDWQVRNGELVCTPGSGYIQTREKFGDCQLHVEWAAPTPVQGESQGRGNSGIFLMGMTEIQVLDNYDNPTYADGFAGSVYGVMPPMVNPLHKPGEWQSYDIVFRRPIVKDGVVLDPGAQTVFINGVLVQDNTPLEGGGGHKSRSNPKKAFPETGPLQLQDHGNPVRYRNIWLRNIRKRPLDGGTDGQLSPEATTAKRAEIAATIREKAATATSDKDQLLLLMESLCYQAEPTVTTRIAELGAKWLEEVKATPADKLANRKGEVTQIHTGLQYLVKHQRMAAGTPLQSGVKAIMTANNWNEKKR